MFSFSRFLPAMTRIILQKKFLPASHEELLLAFQTLDTGSLTFPRSILLNISEHKFQL
jgi:hypothetical protein